MTHAVIPITVARPGRRSTPEFRAWTSEAAKAGNVMMDASLFETIAF